MLFMVGVEEPKQVGKEAYGIIVPAFEALDYTCVSAADTYEEILPNSKDAILSMVEMAIEDKYDILLLDQGFKDYRKIKEYKDYKIWIAVEVNLAEVQGKRVRFNASFNDALLARIDTAVETGPYKDRSAFLEQAARHELEHRA